MIQGEEEIPTVQLAGDELEPYRRLIELQRQMIELVRQHEKTKRECKVLREQLSREMAILLRARQSRYQGISRTALRWIARAVSSLKPREENRSRQNASLLRTTTP